MFHQGHKARLVYRNHPFVNSSTWDQVFAPVVDKATLRIFFTISGREKLYIRQADVVTAYLNAAMDEEVFIKLPKICGYDLKSSMTASQGFIRSPEGRTTLE